MRIAVTTTMIFALVGLHGCCTQPQCKMPKTPGPGNTTARCPDPVRCPPCPPAARRAAPRSPRPDGLSTTMLWKHARQGADNALRLSQGLLKRKPPRIRGFNKKKIFEFEGDDVTSGRWSALVTIPTPACMARPAGSVAQARQRVAKATGAKRTLEELKLVFLLRRQRRVTRIRAGGLSEADRILGRILKLPNPPPLAYCLSNGSRLLRSAERLIKYYKPSPKKKGRPVVNVRIAQLFADQGRLTEASKWLRKVRSRAPKMQLYRQYVQAWIHLYRGQYAQAQRLLLRVLRGAPGKLQPYALTVVRSELIRVFVKTMRPGSPVKALQRLLGVKKTVDLAPDLRLLGRAAHRMGEPAKALAAWNALLDFDRVRASAASMNEVFFGLVTSYGELGQSRPAAQRAVGVGKALWKLLTPKKVKAHLRLAQLIRGYLSSLARLHHSVYLKVGDLDDAFAAATYYRLYLQSGPAASRKQALNYAGRVSALVSLLVQGNFPYHPTRLGVTKYPPGRRPKVFMGRASVSPSLSALFIRMRVRGRLRSVRGCYTEALNRKPTLAGTVKAKLTIPPNGKATRVTVSATGAVKDPKLMRCIQRVVGQLRFPRSPRGYGNNIVTYPFRLKPSKH